MNNENQFKLVLEDEDSFKKTKYFISGFQGLGSVGFIAVKHLIDNLEIDGKKVSRIGVIKSKAAPPFIYLENERIAVPFELYALDEFLFFLPRLPPYRHDEREFSESIASWIINSKQFKMTLLVGGVDKSLKDENDSNVKFVPTRSFKELEDYWPDLKDSLLSSGLMIQGPLAIMLGLLDLEKFPALGILSYAEREKPDLLGAAEAIKVINSLLKINCSLDELIDSSDSVDKDLKPIPLPPQDYSGGPPETYT